MSKLNELADACNNGACNVCGLLLSLSEAVRERGHGNGPLSDDPALKCIIGHISYLIGESLGPSGEALQDYEASKHPAPMSSGFEIPEGGHNHP